MIEFSMWFIVGLMALAVGAVAIIRRRASVISEVELDRLIGELNRADAPDPAAARAAQQASLPKILNNIPANDSNGPTPPTSPPSPTRLPRRTRRTGGIRARWGRAAAGTATGASTLAAITYGIIQLGAPAGVLVFATLLLLWFFGAMYFTLAAVMKQHRFRINVLIPRCKEHLQDRPHAPKGEQRH